MRRWRSVELKEPENIWIDREDELLSLWRREAPPLGDTKLAREIRMLLMSVTPIGTKHWERRRAATSRRRSTLSSP